MPMKFGELAIEYWRVYGDAKAREYLARARRWLLEEVADAPWNRGIMRILERVERECSH
jgi:hypothetical protein